MDIFLNMYKIEPIYTIKRRVQACSGSVSNFEENENPSYWVRTGLDYYKSLNFRMGSRLSPTYQQPYMWLQIEDTERILAC